MSTTFRGSLSFVVIERSLVVESEGSSHRPAGPADNIDGWNLRVEADDGYIGERPQKVKCPKGAANCASTEAIQQKVRNRQETVNCRFKSWGCLKQVWRNDIRQHGSAFTVIAIITQLAMGKTFSMWIS